MADKEVPPIPVPPVEPAPRAPRAKKPVEPAESATVLPPLVDLAGTGAEAPPAAAQPNPYVQPHPYAQPAPAATYPAPGQAYAGQPYAAQPYTPGPPSGLAITSMVLGIAGFVLNAFWIGFLPAVAAIITGHLAQKRQPHAKGFWLTGLITGYIAAVWGALVVVFFIVTFVLASSSPSYY